MGMLFIKHPEGNTAACVYWIIVSCNGTSAKGEYKMKIYIVGCIRRQLCDIGY